MSDIFLDAGTRAEQARAAEEARAQQAASDALYGFRNTLLEQNAAGAAADLLGGQTDTEQEDPIARQMRLDREERLAEREAEAVRTQRDARVTINRALDAYGLADLADYAYNEIILKRTVNPNNPDAVIFALREQPSYQKRFAGNAARVKKGLPELDPQTYIDLESQYRETLRSALGPDMFEVYNDPADFTALIEGDVSNAELNDRLQDGYRAVAEADPEVKRQMQRLYGVTDQQLVGYFLNPEKASGVLTRQARAAQIAARGAEQGGIQLSGALAEDLARRGVTEAEAQRGFAEIGALGELRQAFAGETALTQEQLVNQQFGTDIQAQQELERRRRLRIGEFAGGGQFAQTRGGTSGATQIAIGEAQ